MGMREWPGWPAVVMAGAVGLVLAGGGQALASAHAGAVRAGAVRAGTARPGIAAGYGKGAGFCASVVSTGYDLGASYDDVYPCGPEPGGSFPSYGDAFQPEGGFQCTELANRFLFDAWGYSPVFGSNLDGANYAQTVHGTDPKIPLVANGTAGQPYLPGDIVSFTGNSDEPDGHVAVVIASTENSAGNGSVTIMEENAASSGQETLTVAGWSLKKAGGSYVTPYDFLALQAPVTPPPPPPAVTTSNLLLNGSFWDDQTTGWHFLPVDGGTGSFTAYSSASVPEGDNYLEFNTSAVDGSVYQDVTATLQPNQSYTFSAWVRANSSRAESVCLALFGIGPDTQNGRTCRTVHRSWTLISAPYDVGPSGETDLRAQVYLGTTGVNCDITGTSFAASRPQAPRAPRSVQAKAGRRRATVTWTAPSWSGGTPIVAYIVTVSGGRKVTVGGSARSVTITGLRKHARYTFTVTAVNGAVTGGPSAASKRITTS